MTEKKANRISAVLTDKAMYCLIKLRYFQKNKRTNKTKNFSRYISRLIIKDWHNKGIHNENELIKYECKKKQQYHYSELEKVKKILNKVNQEESSLPKLKCKVKEDTET